MTPRWLSPWIVLPLAVLVGFLIRLVPCLRDRSFDFVVDAAYHERLVRETVRLGHLPILDSLSNAPAGRRTANELPLGLYAAAAVAHHVLSPLGSRDLRWNLVFLVALSGALIAIPVWIGARAARASPAVASLAAFVSVFLPAHLERSEGFYFRFDAPGTLLVAIHAALALAALSAERPAPRWALACGSALALVAALCFWRVSLVVLGFELLFGAVWAVLRGATPGLKALWIAIAAVGTLGLAPVSYLRQHEFLLSPLWLGVVGLAMGLALPALAPSRRPLVRLATLAVLGVVAVVAARFHASGDYSGVMAMLPARLGLARGHDAATALMLDIQELHGLSPWKLLAGTRQFAVLGAWLVGAPLILWWLGGRPSPRPAPALEPAPAALASVTAMLVLFTLAFERMSMLLAPFLMMALGVLAARLIEAPPRTAERASEKPTGPTSARVRQRGRASRGSRPRPGRSARRWLAIALAASAGTTLAAGLTEAFTSWAHLPPNEHAALGFLRDHAPRGAVVLSLWDAGYDIQNQTGLAAVVDGLLENGENRRRIIELDRAFMEPGPAALEHLCDRFHVTWLLIPPPTWVGGVAVVTDDPIAPILKRGEPLVVGPQTDHMILHLMQRDLDFAQFRERFAAGGFCVYEIVRATAPVK
jgi:hypothetical protein